MPPNYPQAIRVSASGQQVINVNNANGIALCRIVASGYQQPTTATFQGSTLGGGIVRKIQDLPRYNMYGEVTFDDTWLPLSAITITYRGPGLPYTTDIWEISYVVL